MTTVRQLISKAKHRLGTQAVAALEAEILLSRAMGVSRAHLFAHPEAEVEEQAAADFEDLVARRSAGEPLAYITGEREFWTLALKVSPAVLIPRPETELVVETALGLIPAEAQWRIADLGTGSGAIALAIATERPRCRVMATDISPDALDVARHNARRLGVENVEFFAGSWMEPLDGKFDVVVSNPPYVAEGDPHLEAGDVRFEPRGALLGGLDGLDAIRRIAAVCAEHIPAGGWLIMEHGHDQAEPCARALARNGFKAIETLCDLEGTKRVTLGRRPGTFGAPDHDEPAAPAIEDDLT